MQPWQSTLLVAALLTFPLRALGCDICGCSSGSNPMGLLPLLERHLLGTRAASQLFHTTPHGSGSKSSDVFHTLELWGRYQVSHRTQLLTFIPYEWNTRSFEDQSLHQVHGLGDVSWSLQQQLFAGAGPNLPGIQHRLLGSIGMKLPTGTIDARDAEGRLFNYNLQPGSGSYWLTTGVLYALLYKSWGMVHSAEGSVSNRNPQGYQKGRFFQYGMRLFYQQNFPNGALLPQLALHWERSGVDQDLNGPLAESGGSILLVNVGAERIWKQWMLGIHSSIPIQDRLARGYVTAKPRWSFSAVYFLGKKIKEIPVISLPGPTDWVQPITIKH